MTKETNANANMGTNASANAGTSTIPLEKARKPGVPPMYAWLWDDLNATDWERCALVVPIEDEESMPKIRAAIYNWAYREGTRVQVCINRDEGLSLEVTMKGAR